MLLNSIGVSEIIVNQIVKLRLKYNPFQEQFADISQNWGSVQPMNNITIQIFQYQLLVEEWNIQSVSSKNDNQIFDKDKFLPFKNDVDQFIKEMIQSGRDQGTLRYMMIINQQGDRSSNWDDPSNISVRQVQLMENNSTITVSVAYQPYNPNASTKSKNEFQFKGRARFLSDDISELSLGSKNDSKNGKTKIDSRQKFILDPKGQGYRKYSSPNTEQPTSPTNRVQFMSVFSKKDDVEIVSSPEDVQKIIGSNHSDDFEIEFVIVQIDFATFIKEQRLKLQHSCQEIYNLLNIIINY